MFNYLVECKFVLCYKDAEVEMEENIDEDEAMIDIDASDKKNPLAVIEYINDIYAFYKKTEVNFGLILSANESIFFIFLYSLFDCVNLIAELKLCPTKLHGSTSWY